MTLSPKQRFLTSTHASKHLDWANSDVAKAACEATLAEMALSLKGQTLERLEGAAHFANLLLSLSEPEKNRKRPSSETLRYDQTTKPHHD